jgi:hypothetical protein
VGARAKRRSTTAAAALAAVVLLLAHGAAAAAQPRYDVPRGFTRCAAATAWNGFFKWASVRHASCHRVKRFMRAYARAAAYGPMPQRLRGFHCRIHFWRNADGDVYASRHVCSRAQVVIRFYGMV